MRAWSSRGRSDRATPSSCFRRSPDLMQAAERIEMLLAGSPDRRTASRYLGRLRAESPVEFDRISHSQAALRAAVAVFAYSNFLSEAVLRDPGRLLEVAASNRLYRVH